MPVACRLVANMITSNVNSKINRSMDDPLLLAAELGRYGLTTTKEIRSVLKAYAVRVMATPSLSLKRTTGECTARLMDRSKMSEAPSLLMRCWHLSSPWVPN